jgi:hypothetical protein
MAGMKADARGWLIRNNKKIVLSILLLMVWTMVADGWTDKGCSLPQGYAFTITHGGSPDRDQGCDEGAYTDRYYG